MEEVFVISGIIKERLNDAILDLVLTNLYDHYDKPQTFPAFGLFDHNTISVSPPARKPGTASDKFILKPAEKQGWEDIYAHLIGLCYRAPLKTATIFSVFSKKL